MTLMAELPIDLNKPRYSQKSFEGRLKHFIDVVDIRNLFASTESIKEAKTLLDSYNNNGISEAIDVDKLWKAKKLVDSSVHPDTGEVIFLPFRMASFVPTNLLVTAGLLLPNPSIAGIIFWQWANQSVNVAINWANANKSTEMSIQETATAYGTAVTASVGVALGLTKAVKSLRVSPSLASTLGRLVPFAAVASASSLNVFLMRRKEMTEGINVTDENGNIVGSSTKAGFQAVSQVAVSRVLTAFPALVLPPLILSRLETMRFMQYNPRLAIPINLGLITLALVTALPCAIATFPQIGQLPVSELEAKFHNLQDKQGNPITHVYYNKGL